MLPRLTLLTVVAAVWLFGVSDALVPVLSPSTLSLSENDSPGTTTDLSLSVVKSAGETAPGSVLSFFWDAEQVNVTVDASTLTSATSAHTSLFHIRDTSGVYPPYLLTSDGTSLASRFPPYWRTAAPVSGLPSSDMGLPFSPAPAPHLASTQSSVGRTCVRGGGGDVLTGPTSDGATLKVSVVDDTRVEGDGHAGWITAELDTRGWFGGASISCATSNDGAYACTTGTCTDVNTYTHVTSASTAAGSITIAVASGAGFSDGDDVLIWQTQSASAPTTRAGRYQVTTIRSGGGTTTFTLVDPLEFQVTSGTFNDAASEAAQVVRVPRYSSFSVSSGATVAAGQWDGQSGGVLAFAVLDGGSVSVQGTLSADGAGFRGGGCGACGDANWGEQGESYLGLGAGNTLAANGNGGGGGYGISGFSGDPGGGGGHFAAGSIGDSEGQPTHDAEGGQAVPAYVTTEKLFMGGGGGGPGDQDGNAHPNFPDGGGVILVNVPTVDGSGVTATAVGEDGSYGGTNGAGASGGGGGGLIALHCRKTSTNACPVIDLTVSGGAQVTGSGTDIGGAGGVGVIANPAATSLSPATYYSLAVSIEDNETPAALVVPAGPYDLDASSGTYTYNVSLSTEPLTDVTVRIDDGPAAGGSHLQVVDVVIPRASWSEGWPVTITAANPGTFTGVASHSVLASTTTDSAYQALSLGAGASPTTVVARQLSTADLCASGPAALAVTYTPTVALTESASPGPQSTTYSVSLMSAPPATVSVALLVSDTSTGAVVTPAQVLNFTTSSWSTAQVVTVTAVDDTVVEPTPRAVSVTHRRYADTDTSATGTVVGECAVSLTVADNDVAEVIVSPPHTLQLSSVMEYKVTLSAQPSQAVTVTFDADTNGDIVATTLASPLVFTTSTWSVPQTVTILGLNFSVNSNTTVTFTPLAETGGITSIAPAQRTILYILPASPLPTHTIVSLTHNPASTTLANTGTAAGNDASAPDLWGGEEITYTAVFRLTESLPSPQGADADIAGFIELRVDLDNIASGALDVASSRIVSIGANVSPDPATGMVVGTPASTSDPVNSGAASRASWVLGFTSVTRDGTADAADEITVEIVARRSPYVVTDYDYTGVYKATAFVYGGLGTPSLQETTPGVDFVLDHDLLLIIDASPNEADGGDLVSLVITVEHRIPGSQSLEVAYDVNITFAGGTIYDIDHTSITSDNPSAVFLSGTDPSDSDVIVYYPSIGPPVTLNEKWTIRFNATLNNSVATAASIPGSATADSAHSPGGFLAHRVESTFGIRTPQPQLTFNLTSTTIANTVKDRFYATYDDIAVGETATFEATVVFGEGESRDVSLELRLPSLASGGRVLMNKCEITFVGANVLGAQGMTLGAKGDESDTDGDGRIDRSFFNFPLVYNSPDNAATDDDKMIITVEVTVIDIPNNAQGVPLDISMKIIFGKEEIVCYETTYDNGAKREVLLPIQIATDPDTFYQYGSPVASSSNTGKETSETVLLYFVSEPDGRTSFVAVYDKADDGSGGRINVDITSDNLAGLNPPVILLREDDPAGGTDTYGWNPVTASGEMYHQWATCCTDGFVLGRMPSTDFCFRMNFFIGDPVKQPQGITQFSLMIETEGKIQYNFIDPSEVPGLEVCGVSCVAATNEVASRSTTYKLEVVEPTQSMSRTPTGTDAHDAGDVISYTVTIVSPAQCCDPLVCGAALESCSSLWDAVYVNEIPTELTLGTVTPSRGTVVTSGNSFNVTLGEFVPGETVTITYSVTVDISSNPGDVFVNDAFFYGCSHPDGLGRCVALASPHTVTINAPVLSQLVVSGSSDGTTGTAEYRPAPAEDLKVGETVTIDITVRMPEASAENSTVTFVFPYGGTMGKMEVTDIELVAFGTKLSNTAGLIVGSKGTVSNLLGSDAVDDTAVLDFGTIVNAGDNSAPTTNDDFTVRVTATMYSDPSTFVSLETQVNATYSHSVATLSGSVLIDVVGPQLSIVKTRTPTTADAGDVIAYSITVTHAAVSSASAPNVVITDLLGEGLTLVPGSVSCSNVDASLDGTTVEADGSLRLATDASLLTTDPDPTCTYSAVVGNGVGYNSTGPLENRARVTWTEGTAESKTTVGVLNDPLGWTVTLVGTDVAGTGTALHAPGDVDLVIGESVTYQGIVQLREGTSWISVEVSIPHPPEAFAITSSYIELGSQVFIVDTSVATNGTVIAAAGSSSTLTFPLGQVVNIGDNSVDAGDEISFHIVLTLLEHASNTDGATRTFTTVLNHTGPTLLTTGPTSHDVAGPAVTLAKTATPPGATVPVHPSSVVSFALDVTRTGGTTDLPMFDVVLEDPLDAHWVIVPGSEASNDGGVAVSISGNTITATVASYSGASFQITYDARLSSLVDTTLSTGTWVNNTATLTWNGQSSEPTSQRVRTASDHVVAEVINDPPVITPPGSQPVSGPEETVTALSGLSIADVDVHAGSVNVTLSATDVTLSLGVSTGLTLATGASGKLVMFTASLADTNTALASLSFQGDLNFVGTTSVTVIVDDQGNTGTGGTLSDTETITLDITAVNDAPVLAVPGATSIDEDTSTAFPGISVADVDVGAGDVKVTLSSADLTFTLGTTTGITFTGGHPAKTIVFQGSLADVNTALASLSVLPDSNFEGSTSISVTADDLGNTGTGGALTDVESISITVDNVLDVTTLVAVDTTFTEGGTIAGNSLISVKMTGVSDRVVTVTCNISPGTAVAGTGDDQDYTDGSPYVLTYAVGESGDKFEDVTITNDLYAEEVEQFSYTCSASAPGANATFTDDTGVVTITDNEAFTVTWSSGTYGPIAESSGSAKLTVQRTAGILGPFSVDVTFTDTGATGGGTDYNSTTKTVVFGANDASVDINVEITDDVLAETAETFKVTLGNLVDPSGRGSIGAADTTVTIGASDPFDVFFSAGIDTVAEPAVVTNRTITVSRTPGIEGAFTVDVVFTGGTATGGSDYDATTLTAVFGPTDTTVDVQVPINPDDIAEPNETIIATLQNLGGTVGSEATITGQTTKTITISANDPFDVFFASGTDSVNEPAATVTNKTITVSRTPGIEGAFTVDVVFTGGTATGGADYDATTLTAVFGATDANVTVQVPINPDTISELDETIIATLQNLGGTVGSEATITGQTTTTITIPANDPFDVFFASGTDTVNEPAATVTNMSVAVSRTPGIEGAFTVDVVFTGGTATGGSDYDATTLTAVFGPTDTTVNVQIPINPDDLAEPDETIIATLQNLGGALGSQGTITGQTTTTITINANDPFDVFFASGTDTVAEPAVVTNRTITVSRTPGIEGAFTVDVVFTGGTATGGADYDATTLTAVFGLTDTTVDVQVPINPDDLAEPNETIIATLQNLGGTVGSEATIAGQTTTTITISANDPFGVSFSSATFTVDESGPTATITVIRTGVGRGPFTVDVVLTAGTAQDGGVDFTETTLPATFLTSTMSVNVSVPINDDSLTESTETFTAALGTLTESSGQGSKSGTVSSTVSIIDNDATVVAVNDASAAEGNTNNALVSVTVTGQADRDVNITCTLSPGSAVPGTADGQDYTDATFTFHYAPTQVGTRAQHITLNDDTMSELTETLSVTCVHSTPPVSDVTISPATATATITDDDTSRISVADTVAVESSGAGNSLVSVSLDNPADRNVTVECTLVPGTAVAGTGFAEDYTDETFSITFTPGQTGPLTRGITLTVDNVAEETESLLVVCTEQSGGVAVVLKGNGTAQINDDDTAVINVLDTSSFENVTDNNLVEVTMSIPASRQVNLTCTLIPDTAVVGTNPGEDYTDETFEITYNPGDSGTVTRDVVLTDDNTAEGVETFNVSCVETTSGVVVISDPVGIATISPDDLSVVTVLDTTVSEGDFNNNTAISVSMNVVNDRQVDVSCSLTAGTATVGGDYTDGSPYLFTYNPGETGLKTLVVTLTNDLTREEPETLTVNCVETTGGVAVINDGQATITITDDDIVTLTVNDRTSTEPTAANGLVQVALGGIADAAVDFTCWLEDGTATDGSDYTNQTFVFSYAAGGSGVQTANVTLIDDIISEDQETLTVRCVETGSSVVTVLKDSAVLTVNDDDRSDLTIQATSAAEESVSANTLVSVTLTGASDRVISVTCTLIDGTATAGSDFVNATEVIVFGIGATGLTTTRAVTLIDDAVNEAPESFTVTCEETGGVTSTGVTWSGGMTAVATITDGDTSTLDVLARSGAENGGGAGLVAVNMTGVADRTITFSCSLVPGTAVPGTADGQDYTPQVYTFTYTALTAGLQTDTLVLNDDTINEADETLSVTCSETSGGIATVAIPTETVTITDDDVSILVVQDRGVTEGAPATNGLISVNLTGRADRAINVSCTFVPGTAIAGSNPGEDYTDATTVISIPAFTQGVTQRDVVITDDAVTELTESFSVTCAEISGGIASFTDDTGVVTVTDDDTSSVTLSAGNAVESLANNNLISVTMTGVADRRVNLTCTLTPGTALPGTGPGQDYVDQVFQFTFPPFTDGNQNANLSLNDDAVDELQESLTYDCTETTAAVLTGAIAQETLTIDDDDTAVLCAVSTAYGEGSGSPPFVEVTLSIPSDRPVTVDFTLSPATASDVADAALVNGTLSWAALASGTRTATVAVVDDFLVEANETISLSLSSPTGGAVIGGGGCDAATLTIVENDYLVCGDGVRYAGEECDDGNLADGDGCSSSCVVEPNAQCVVTIGATSICRVLWFTPTTVREDDVFGTAGDVVVTIEVVGDTWDAGIGTDPTLTNALLAAVTGSLGTAYAYDAVVAPSLSASNVTRVNATHVTITIGPLRNFAIDADEKVAVQQLPSTILGSGVNFTLTNETSFTIQDTGFTVVMEGSSLACDASGASFSNVRAYSNISIAVYGSNFDTAAWSNSASAFAFYDSLGLTGTDELACLTAHVLNGERPDELLHPSSFIVDDQSARIVFPRRLPAYLQQLSAARSVTLPAAAVTAGLQTTVQVHCNIVWN